MSVDIQAQFDGLMMALLDAAPDSSDVAQIKKQILRFLNDHPELIDDDQEVFRTIRIYECADPRSVADVDADKYHTWIQEQLPNRPDSQDAPSEGSLGDSNSPLLLTRWLRGGLAAAATVILCVGVWWIMSSNDRSSSSVPAFQIVELSPLGTDSWQPFSLERKVLPSNHAYRLSPVDVDNNYLAVRDSTGMTLTPLRDVAGDNWVVSIHGREGENASLFFIAKSTEMSDVEFRRMVESQLASIPSTPSIEPGYRLVHATDDTKVERAGGVSLGSPDDPPPPTPQWATDLADRLRAEGIHISGWTFPLSEE